MSYDGWYEEAHEAQKLMRDARVGVLKPGIAVILTEGGSMAIVEVVHLNGRVNLLTGVAKDSPQRRYLEG